jgi:uncharacterized membrane protein
MRGNVIGFDADTNQGAIAGDNGGRFDFVGFEWHGAARPSRGTAVDFVPVGQQATQIYPVVARYDPAESGTAKIIYILYLVSLFLGFTSVVGLILAYVNRGGAPEWVQTHYRFQIRTFWIGCLYGLASIVTAPLVIGFLFALFTAIWFIVRCAKGLKATAAGAPYENAGTWLW